MDYNRREHYTSVLKHLIQQFDLNSVVNRVNEKYFYGMILVPNLKWGNKSLSQLGTYDYGTDTITVSRILEKESILLDYVMYHEILHKKIKFKEKNGRSIHHSKEWPDQ